MSTIFFDLDDTIYDRGIPFEQAFAAFFGHSDPELARKAYQTCSVRSNEVFEDSRTGRITMEEMYIYRYQRGFADVGITLTDAQALEYQRTYAYMQSHLTMTDTMRAVLDTCATRFDAIGILTNGPGSHQRDKIAALGLDKWVRDEMIIASGEHGIVKPDLQIFEIARHTAHCENSEMIYVGDSLDTDIAPALTLGWKTVWLNRKGKSLKNEQCAPTCEVRTEEELLACLSTL